MTTDLELMKVFSTPRPSGSAAESRVYRQICAWLADRGIQFTEQSFRLYPWFMQSIGIWLILSRSLLFLAVAFEWGWITLPIALVGLLGGLVDIVTGYPMVGWAGACTGHNLLIEFTPQDPQREIILSAHYDSKTELLDHRQRMFFLRSLPAGIILTLVLGLLGPFQALAAEIPWLAGSLQLIGIGLGLVMLGLAWGIGANLALGRLRRVQSQGAVDNGAACAILLRLAEQYHIRSTSLVRSKLTLALFGGEEVNMQGSLAFVRTRSFDLPAAALNLEVMAQNGDYVIWEQDGISLRLWPNSPEVIAIVCAAVEAEIGTPPRRVGPINSDGGSFNRAGIPAATLGTYDRQLADRGFHLPTDNLERVVVARIPEAVRILTRFIERIDERELT